MINLCSTTCTSIINENKNEAGTRNTSCSAADTPVTYTMYRMKGTCNTISFYKGLLKKKKKKASELSDTNKV